MDGYDKLTARVGGAKSYRILQDASDLARRQNEDAEWVNWVEGEARPRPDYHPAQLLLIDYKPGDLIV